jgi:hypothetical protein
MRGIDARAGFDRLFDHAPHEGRRFGHESGAIGLDRAQQRRLQRRLVLLEVERHLFVGDPTPQRPDEEPRDQREPRQRHDHARGDDRSAAEAQELQAVRREQEQGRSRARPPTARREAPVSCASGCAPPR